MLIIGHPHIPYGKLYHIGSIEAVEHTPSNSTLLFSCDSEVFELIEHARANDIAFGLHVNSLKEAVICENLEAKYLIVPQNIAKRIQNAADHYLFDAKVLVQIQEEDEIEEVASEGIDGVIFSEAIIKIS